jgi:hypothetical protein
MRSCVTPEGVCHDDEEEISESDDQAQGETDRRLLAMGRYSERDRDQCERRAASQAGKAFVEFAVALILLPENLEDTRLTRSVKPTKRR